ncbi:hypothetical protein V2A60_004195 [Cordyceps javanica]
MVQRDDLLPVAFGGALISLVMMLAMPFNLLVAGALATFLVGIAGSYYGSADFMGKIKSAVASTEIFAEQIPSQTTYDSEDAIDLLESFRRAQEIVKGSPHEAEKERLLKSLQRDHTWSSSHPRHRLLDALFGFQNYYERQQVELERFRGLYKHLSKKHKTLLDLHIQYSSKFDRVDEHLAINQQLCDKIVQSSLAYYQIPPSELKKHGAELVASGKRADKTSVSQAMKHYVRDWSPSGRNECEETFPALLGTLEELFPDRSKERDAPPLRVLLPGSGLNRLAHEVARLGGFQVTANEWSAFMNVAYRFLETFPDVNASSCHPFADTWSHHITEGDMVRTIRFPDVAVNRSSVLLVEGDFTTVFNHEPGSYDVLLTYFFIDTARNLMTYFDTITKLLKPGGYWINLGPLLYGTAPLVQLSLEEIISVTETMGFEYLETNEQYGSLTIPGRTVRGMRAVYSFNDKALTTSAYKAQFWVAQKK